MENKINKNDILGFLAYFFIGFLFGHEASFLCLIVHEDNDRCHYYNGKWRYKDLLIGLAAIILSYIIKRFIL